jgi:hypothetical protein
MRHPASELLDQHSHTLLGSTAGAILVGQPVPKPGVERWCDDENVGVRQPLGDGGVESDDEHAPPIALAPDDAG